MATNPTIQREIKSVVDLALAHAHKVYFSGPLIRRIERVADGNKPARDDGWVDVWAQLGGTTLSVWDMKAIEEANKRGEEVPPSYINITDCVRLISRLDVAELGSDISVPVCSSPRCINKPCNSDGTRETIHKCYHNKHRGIQLDILRMSFIRCPCFLG